MSGAYIQGFVEVQLKQGAKWKRKYLVLDNGGYLQLGDKKGGKASKTFPITPNSQINSLAGVGVPVGISVTGANHDPIYLKLESEEVADGWLRALNIMKSGGSSKNLTANEKDKESKMRNAYANHNVMGKSGDTLERKQGTLGRKQGTLGRKKKNGSNKALKEEDVQDLPPPPPPSQDPALSSDEDASEPGDIVVSDIDDDEEEEDSWTGPKGDNCFEDGYMMHIRGMDYFVDKQGWEYYASREEFHGGEKPIGRAILSMLI